MDDTNFTTWACPHYPRLVVSARLVTEDTYQSEPEFMP